MNCSKASTVGWRLSTGLIGMSCLGLGVIPAQAADIVELTPAEWSHDASEANAINFAGSVAGGSTGSSPLANGLATRALPGLNFQDLIGIDANACRGNGINEFDAVAVSCHNFGLIQHGTSWIWSIRAFAVYYDQTLATPVQVLPVSVPSAQSAALATVNYSEPPDDPTIPTVSLSQRCVVGWENDIQGGGDVTAQDKIRPKAWCWEEPFNRWGGVWGTKPRWIHGWVGGDDLAGKRGLASAISESGVVVGTSGERAFYTSQMWDRALLLEPFAGAGSSRATAVNSRSVVVGSATNEDGVAVAASWWCEAGYAAAPDVCNQVPIALGGVPGHSASYALSINDGGEVVGWSLNAKGEQRAIYWGFYDTLPPVDLNSWIPAALGWELLEARGINNKGQIVGIGLKNGVRRGFLLTP